VIISPIVFKEGYFIPLAVVIIIESLIPIFFSFCNISSNAEEGTEIKISLEPLISLKSLVGLILLFNLVLG